MATRDLAPAPGSSSRRRVRSRLPTIDPDWKRVSNGGWPYRQLVHQSRRLSRARRDEIVAQPRGQTRGRGTIVGLCQSVVPLYLREIGRLGKRLPAKMRKIQLIVARMG